MRKIVLHPVTRLSIALSFIIFIWRIPLAYQAIAVFLGAIIIWGIAKPLPSQDPGNIFLRLWLTAGFFLTMIHTISYDDGLIFNQDRLYVAGKSFFRIGSLMVAFLWIIRTMKTEELYAMLIDLRLPIPVIYVIFQALYLIPRLIERAKDILVAQQARGFILRGVRRRIKALILILSPLFSTMIYELEEGAASIAARGLHAPGMKSHINTIRLTVLDSILIGISIIITVLLVIS
jgi:energy-coupling factor transport system permease protein